MKDNKIDKVLEEHFNDYDEQAELILQILGQDFIDKINDFYATTAADMIAAKIENGESEEDLEVVADFYSNMADETIKEAKDLIVSFASNNNHVTARMLDNYRFCLLESYIRRAQLDIDQRKIYIEAYMFAMENNLSDISYHEELITKKSLVWFETKRQDNDEEELKRTYYIVSMAIKDQVYTEILDEKILRKKVFPKVSGRIDD